jgi:hypothetical protein
LYEYSLLDECGGRELTLLDGNAFLLNLLSNKYLDTGHGGQMLHLLFLAERTLKEWMDRGMQFQVFFFKMEKKLSFEKEPFDNQMIQVARELLREHMRRALHLTVVNFSGTPFENNGEWDSYLKKTLPSFIITRLSSEYERRFANECKRRGFAIAVDLRLDGLLYFCLISNLISHFSFFFCVSKQEPK